MWVLLMTDSTHVKANVRNDIFERITVEIEPSEYLKRINKEAETAGLCDNIKKLCEYENETKEVIKSTTDPDAGFMKRVGKPLGFYYLNHQTCDSKHGIITDSYTTPGNTLDATVHSKRICHQIDEFELKTEFICADAGYDFGEIHKDMLDRNIQTYIPLRESDKSKSELFTSKNFKYNEDKDVLVCPNNKELAFYKFFPIKGNRRYISNAKQCKTCSFKGKCLSGNMTNKRVERAFYKTQSEKQHKADGSTEYLAAMRLRKILCEGNFSHQKARHNLLRLNKWGLGNASIHCLLSACAFNLKRMVKLSFA